MIAKLSRTIKVLLIVLVAFQILDLITTYYILNTGGVELNPIARLFIDNLAAGIGVKVLVTGLIIIVCWKYSRYIIRGNFDIRFNLGILVTGLIMVTVFQGFIVGQNFLEIWRL